MEKGHVSEESVGSQEDSSHMAAAAANIFGRLGSRKGGNVYGEDIEMEPVETPGPSSSSALAPSTSSISSRIPESESGKEIRILLKKRLSANLGQDFEMDGENENQASDQQKKPLQKSSSTPALAFRQMVKTAVGSNKVGDGPMPPRSAPSSKPASPQESNGESEASSDEPNHLNQDTEEKTRRVNGVLQRRYSTDNVNRRRFMALLRRLRKYRFRSPRQSTSVKYLQYFLSILYYLGLSPLKPASAKMLPKWFLWLQTIFFWSFATISVIDALADTKSGWMQFHSEENMLNFVSLGFYVSSLATRLYYLKLFATCSAAASSLFKNIAKVNDNAYKEKSGICTWPRLIAVGLVTFSIFLVGIYTILGAAPFSVWTFRKAVLVKSYEVSDLLFRWSSENFDNKTDQLWGDYGTELSPTVELFAAIGSLFNYSAYLHSCVLLDFWSILAIQVYILQYHFSNAMEKTRLDKRRGKICPPSIHWKHYMDLRGVCDQLSDLFGKLLELIHMQNILLFGYFLLELLKKEPMSFALVIDFVSVVKVSLTYYLAQVSADKNDKYEECVITCSERRPTINIDGTEVSVPVLLKDMERHPIGIGRGNFFIDQTFVLKFVAIVGSIFMLLSDSDKCNGNNDK